MELSFKRTEFGIELSFKRTEFETSVWQKLKPEDKKKIRPEMNPAFFVRLENFLLFENHIVNGHA